jgi:hypothetical protein
VELIPAQNEKRGSLAALPLVLDGKLGQSQALLLLKRQSGRETPGLA